MQPIADTAPSVPTYLEEDLLANLRQNDVTPLPPTRVPIQESFIPWGEWPDSNTILEIDYTESPIANDKTLQQITNKVIQLKCRYHATKHKLKYLNWCTTHEITPQQCQPNIDLSTIDHLGIKHQRVICQILEHTGEQILSTHINHHNETLSLTLFQLDELFDMISHSTNPEVKEFILEFTDSQALSHLKPLTISIFDA